MNSVWRSLLVSLLLLSAIAAAIYSPLGAQVLTPRSEDLRFQALLNEPIATPDRRGVVAGTTALLLKDRTTGQCFLAVTVGNSVGLSATECGQ